MARRDKLIARMKAAPHDIRFSELSALLSQEGFVLVNQRGSHCSFHRADGRVLTVVKPHGGRKTCHPCDVRRVLEAIGL